MQAITALGELGNDASISALSHALTTIEDGEARPLVARSLGMLGPKARAAIPTLRQVLHASLHSESYDRQTQYEVVRALGQMGPEAASALPELTDAKASKDQTLKDHAIEAIAKIRH
jgi:HEAT repeat protein